MTFLNMQKINKSFGGMYANRDIDLAVGKGEIHALLGENGAGKTTLMNILYGLYQADSGSISINGEPVRISSPKKAIDLKIGMVHQHFMLVPTLTVSQNITLGMREKGYPFTDRKEIDRKISALSKEYGLDVDPGDIIENLSVGVMQRIEIVKLLYHQAQLLILDEPTAVLTSQETDNLFAVLKRLKKDGRSVVIITHRIGEVQTVADKVTVLRDGAKVGTVNIRDVDDVQLSELMIGRRLDSPQRLAGSSEDSRSDRPLLSLKHIGLSGENKDILNNISLDLKPGEILGVAGVDGNGQKELAEVIVGIRSPTQGSLFFQGEDITGKGVRKRKQMGMAYIPDDRHHDGLVLDMDMTGNLILSAHNQAPFAKYCFLQEQVQRAHAEDITEAYQVKTPGIGTLVRFLSGGNQQKIILARELDGAPKLIVACQPTRGLDIGAEEFIAKLLLTQRKRGVAILLISADLEQLMNLSDRIAVIFDGSITGILPNEGTIDRADIGLKMAGMTGDTG